MGTDSFELDAETEGPAGCEFGPTERRPGRADGLRPDFRREAPPYRAVAEFNVVQRVRPVGSLHHLYTIKPILRGAGGCAAVLAESGRPERHLLAVHRRQHSPA